MGRAPHPDVEVSCHAAVVRAPGETDRRGRLDRRRARGYAWPTLRGRHRGQQGSGWSRCELVCANPGDTSQNSAAAEKQVLEGQPLLVEHPSFV